MLTIIRFFTRIFSHISSRFKFNLKNRFSLNQFYIRHYKVINYILYTISGFAIIIFLYDITTIKCLQILIFTLISLALNMYISDNYTYSNNIFIKIIQKLVFIILKLCLIVFILELFDLNIFNKIHC